MDRFTNTENGKKEIAFSQALEFIGEVRAGIAWDRLCLVALQYADVFIDMLNGTEECREFLALKQIDYSYVKEHLRNLMYRLHFNAAGDYYLTLLLPRYSDSSRLNKRWKDLMLLYHPDRNIQNSEEMAETAKKINEAYSVLKDSDKRADYDRKLQKAAIQSIHRNQYKSVNIRKENSRPGKAQKTLSVLIIPLIAAACVFALFVIYLNNRSAQLYKGQLEAGLAIKPDSKPAGSSEGVSPDVSMPAPGQKQQAITKPLKDIKPAPALKISVPSVSSSADLKNRQADKPGNNTNSASSGKADKNLTGASPQVLQGKDLNIQKEAVADKAPMKTEVTQSQPVVSPPHEVVYEKTSKKAEPMQSQPVAQPPVKAVSENIEEQVRLFINKYIKAYEAGNLNSFISLYSESALENKKLGYNEIKKSYQKYFNGERYTHMDIGSLQFHKKGTNVLVTCSYLITKKNNNSISSKASGNITWTLGRENGELKIVSADYDRK